jgi:hypothetical protein
MPITNEPRKELRIRAFPVRLHKKIGKYIARVLDREDRTLTKETAVEELIDKATKNIKIPE